MATHNQIKKLTQQIKSKKQGRQQLDKLAQCFLKVAQSATGKTYTMNEVIVIANPNLPQITPFMEIEAMTPAKLALIILGCEAILANIGVIIEIDEIMQGCNVSSNTFPPILANNKKTKQGWKPFSV